MKKVLGTVAILLVILMMTSAVSATAPEVEKEDGITIVVNCCCCCGAGEPVVPVKPQPKQPTVVIDNSKTHIHNNYHNKADVKIIKGNGNVVKNNNGSKNK